MNIKNPSLSVICRERSGNTVNLKFPGSLLSLGLKLAKTKASKFDLGIIQPELLDEILQKIKDGNIHLPFTITEIEDPQSGDSIKIALI